MGSIYTSDVSSEHLEAINWYSSAHEQSPPVDSLAAVSLFYSKLNDSFDCMATRVLDKERSLLGRMYDVGRNIYVFFYSSIQLLKGARLHNKYPDIVAPMNENMCVVIDYMSAQGDGRIGVPHIWDTNQKLSSTVAVFHSKDGLPADLVENRSVKDVLLFVCLLVRISMRVPFVRNCFMESLVEKTRELTNFYLFQFFVFARGLSMSRGKIVMLYEDQPRDRLLLYMLKGQFDITAYLHTPALHWYRYNEVYSAGDVLLPDAFLCKYSGKKTMLVDFKGVDKKAIASVSEETVDCSLKDFVFELVVVYLPKSPQIIDEYQKVFVDLSARFGWRVLFVAHPATPASKRDVIYNVVDDPVIDTETTLVVSSFMTNKGYYMIEEGFKVVYLGSDVLPWYNPFPGIDVPFVQSPDSIRLSLLDMGCAFRK